MKDKMGSRSSGQGAVVSDETDGQEVDSEKNKDCSIVPGSEDRE